MRETPIHTHVKSLVECLSSAGVGCNTSEVRLCDLLSDKTLLVRALLRNTTFDQQDVIRKTDFFFIAPNKMHVKTIHALHSDIMLDVFKRDLCVDGNECFAFTNHKISNNVIAETSKINTKPNPLTNCVVCDRVLGQEYHMCDYLTVCNSVCDGENRTMCALVLNRFLATDQSRQQRPCVELILVTPMKLLSAICALVDFLCVLIPDIKHKSSTNPLSVMLQGLPRITISVDAVNDTIDFYLAIVKGQYSFGDECTKSIRCLLVNVSMSVLAHGTDNAIVVPFAASAGQCQSISGIVEHNETCIRFLRNLRRSFITPLFISNIQLPIETSGTDEEYFSAHIYKMCAVESISLIVKATFVPWEQIKNKLISRVIEIPFTCLESEIREFVDFFAQIRAVFDANQCYYITHVLDIEYSDLHTFYQFTHVYLRFLFYCFRHSYRQDAVMYDESLFCFFIQ